MKSKKATKTNTSRIIFFTIAITYNLILGFYLRGFLVLSPTLQVFYLLSALPTWFLTVKINSKAMRSTVYTSLILIACMNIAYAIYCRRVFPFLALVSLVIVFIYFITFADNAGKDNLLTKIYVLIVFALIIVLLFSAYILVYKQDDIFLTNGQATLWDTDTVELADEICADCDTDEEKVKAIYKWIIHNFEYDYDCSPLIQYFNVRKTLSTRKGICYDFSHLFAALCRSQNIPCYVVDGDKRNNAQYHHTWNRVYFNDSWWNMDVTFDIVQTNTQENLYGFRKIKNAYSLEEYYYITKIY
ncbi:MAG: transglutaminase domain-containing protein [Ruminococcaceae bacterium]|nr:transglutaminase domain-containing protein [Oscillospiraceae bacterium]